MLVELDLKDELAARLLIGLAVRVDPDASDRTGDLVAGRVIVVRAVELDDVALLELLDRKSVV